MKRLLGVVLTVALAFAVGSGTRVSAMQVSEASPGQVANDLLDDAAAILTQGYTTGDIMSCAFSGSSSMNRVLIQNSSTNAQKVAYSMDAGTAQAASVTLAREDLNCNAIGGGGSAAGGEFLVPGSSTAVLYITAGGTPTGCSGLEEPGCNMYLSLNGSSGQITMTLDLSLSNGFNNWAVAPASTNTGMKMAPCLTNNGTNGAATAVEAPQSQGGYGGDYTSGQTMCLNIASNAELNGNDGSIPTSYEYPPVFFGSFGEGNVYNVWVEGGTPTCNSGVGPNDIPTVINNVGPSGQVWSDPSNGWVNLDGGSLQIVNTGDNAWPFSIKLLNAAGDELRFNSTGSAFDSTAGSWVTAPEGGFSSGEQPFSPQGHIYSVGAPSPYDSWAQGPLAPSRAPYNWIYISSDNHAHYFSTFDNSTVSTLSGTSSPNYSFVPQAGIVSETGAATATNNCAPIAENTSTMNPFATPLADYQTPVDYAANAPWAQPYNFSPNPNYAADSVQSQAVSETGNLLAAAY